MTQARKDLAALLGVSPSTVTRDAAAGMPTDSLDAARRWRAENRRQNTPPPGREPQGQPVYPADLTAPPADLAGLSYADWRKRREAAEAQEAELRLAESRGELVRAAEVRASVAKWAAAMREAWLSMPARVVPLLAAAATPADMENVLRAEVCSTLRNIVEATP